MAQTACRARSCRGTLFRCGLVLQQEVRRANRSAVDASSLLLNLDRSKLGKGAAACWLLVIVRHLTSMEPALGHIEL